MTSCDASSNTLGPHFSYCLTKLRCACGKLSSFRAAAAADALFASIRFVIANAHADFAAHHLDQHQDGDLLQESVLVLLDAHAAQRHGDRRLDGRTANAVDRVGERWSETIRGPSDGLDQLLVQRTR